MAKQRKQGQQNPNNQPPPDDDEDDGGGGDEFSDSQRNSIVAIVNAAVSGQINRKLPNALKQALDSSIAPLREQMEQLASGGGRRRASDDDDEDDDDDAPPAPRGKQGKQGKGAKGNPEMLAMQKKLDALEAERRAEREQAAARERDGMLRDHLTKLGVDPNRLRGAVAVLRDSLKRDEKTGEWSYVAKRDGYDDDLDVGEGVKEWASTDEGKSYIAPPKGAQQPRGGSGSRIAPAGGGPVLGGGRPTNDPKAAKQERKQAAMDALSGAIGELGGATVAIGG